MKHTTGRSQRMIESFYSGIGPVYNFIYGKLLFNDGRRVAIDFLDVTAGQKVLEVGVGTGLTLPMYPGSISVEGIDLSESMLNQAHDLIQKNRLKNVKVRMMNANHLEYSDNSFDAVLGNLFISATSDPLGALKEMKRVCKPGGTLVLMNHFRSENAFLSKLEDGLAPMAKSVLGFNSALSMDPLLQSAGLKVRQIAKVNLFGFWTAVSMKNEK